MSDDEKPSITAAYDYYGLQILGRDVGQWRKAQCPIPDHEDSNPSASINEDACRWRCHACDRGGDIYDLIMEQEPEVVGLVAAKRRAAQLFGEGDGTVRGEQGRSGLLPPRKRHRQGRRNITAPWMRLG